MNRIEKTKLINRCTDLGVAFVEDSNGIIEVVSGHEYDFLCLLDRRLYSLDLINQVEKYEATGRFLK